MESGVAALLLIDALLFLLAAEGYRHRLAALTRSSATLPEYPLMRPRSLPDEYPFSTSRASLMFGVVAIWTAEYRVHRDRLLTHAVWAARAFMLGLPTIAIAGALLTSSD